MYRILYNPLSGSGQGYDRVQKLKEILKDQEIAFTDVREIKDFRAFFKDLTKDDSVVLTGGDGTLNRFVNSIDGIEIAFKLYYYPTGSGNDFQRDVAPNEKGLIPINEYVKDLPTVIVNGKRYKFLNGIGYGLDGWCCEVGDELAKKTDKPINYSSIAIKGLLFNYKPTNATITVDGKTETFEKVWIAPTMNGRYYGGGLMITPAQDRLNKERTVSLAVMYKANRIKTLLVFAGVSKGKHVSHTEMVAIREGKQISVKFDRPVALQIDGETILGVTEYAVESAALAKKKEPAAAGV